MHHTTWRSSCATNGNECLADSETNGVRRRSEIAMQGWKLLSRMPWSGHVGGWKNVMAWHVEKASFRSSKAQLVTRQGKPRLRSEGGDIYLRP